MLQSLHRLLQTVQTHHTWGMVTSPARLEEGLEKGVRDREALAQP